MPGRVREGLGAYSNRDRVVYTLSQNLAECESITTAFVEQGFRAAFAQTIPALERLFDLRRPDAVLVDYECGQVDGDADSDIVALTHDLSFGVRVFVITNANIAADKVVRAVRAGAVALIERPLAMTEVTYVVASDLRRICSHSSNPAVAGGLSSLSARELDVLRHVMDGRSNKEVALELLISPRTVEAHRASILRKLGARNTAEMIHIAMMDR